MPWTMARTLAAHSALPWPRWGRIVLMGKRNLKESFASSRLECIVPNLAWPVSVDSWPKSTRCQRAAAVPLCDKFASSALLCKLAVQHARTKYVPMYMCTESAQLFFLHLTGQKERQTNGPKAKSHKPQVRRITTHAHRQQTEQSHSSTN